ncbi:ABC transporter ATP-binding protein [Bacillus sp. FJAT-27264]|uniref:ABC transporter ATP-binding protein n=1 Tax=Paenibacillus sp. (strain DSM 101736 / FJAT-27264) TaxID=1850362 RepID=UPI000807B358|nr:ABC transporter ATP-binding protein [Bacillus sp. FJAT-27264]OBZ15082.1 ABC transporter ATP-binding protein [Bacillus sp. FJAT-27264]
MKGSFYRAKEVTWITEIISVHNLSYAYTKSALPPVLSDISLTVSQGEFVSVVGTSGCGKSTLFKIIAGLLEPSSGDLRLHGISATNERLGQIAYMPQQDLLLPWRTVLENCLLPWEIKRSRSKAEVTSQISELLQRLGLAGIEGSFPHELSGGMRQRVAFLRTLITGGDLLLLDEPFGALDHMTKREMHSWLLEILDELDKTILFITHDLEEALLLSDRIFLLPGQAGGCVEEILVDLPRPRHRKMNYEPRFIELRAELERKLYDNPAV